MGVSKFLKKVGTRVCLRYDAATQTDKWGLAHGTVKQLIRDDFMNLIACKVQLDEGVVLTLSPRELIEEKENPNACKESSLVA